MEVYANKKKLNVYNIMYIHARKFSGYQHWTTVVQFKLASLDSLANLIQ